MTEQDRFNAYARPSPDGKGITIDTEGMAVDLVTFFKMGGYSATDLHRLIAELWDKVHVEISIPDQFKN